MPSIVLRRLSLLVLPAAIALSGCAPKSDGEPKAPPSVESTADAPSPTPAPAKPAPKPSSPAPAAFPSDARVYAEAVIAAWKAKNLSRLADLTTPEVHEQLIEIPGPPNMTWTYVRCEGAAGSSYCQFTNADAHVLTLRITNLKLGTAHATSEVRYE